MIIRTNIYNLIPTQEHISRKNLQRLYDEFDPSKYEFPRVVEYRNGKFLLFNGHHRSYYNYRRVGTSLEIEVIEDDDALAREAKGRIQRFPTIDSFIENYDAYIKDGLIKIGLKTVPDYVRFIV